MRLKVLLLAVVVAISFMGIYLPQANAEGPAVTPYAGVKVWYGVTMYDKYSSGKVDKTGKATGDTDFIMGLTPQSSVGVRGSVNNVFVDFSIMAKTPFGDPNPADRSGNQADQTFMFIGAIMYKVGDVNITMGRHFTPYDILAFGDVANQGTSGGWDCLLGYALFDATRDQFRVNVAGFYVGAFRNSKNESAKYDVLIPLIAAGYEFGNPGTPMNFSVHGLYQTYKNDDGANDKSVSSYAGAAKFGMNMAPITFYVTGLYGINPGDMGMACGGNAVLVGSSYKDTTVMAGHGGVDYTMGQMKFSAGVGYKTTKTDISGAKDDAAMSVYASLKYSIQPNFSITPVVLYQDNMKDQAKQKQGTVTTFGVLAEANI